MSLILVVEQDGSYTGRIQGALAAEGWTVEVVSDRVAAMASAAASAPDFVLVSTAAPGAAELLRTFGRAQGGPGAMALTPAGQAAPAAADGSLAKPFTDEQLRVSVRRCLSRGQKAAAEAAAAKAASAGAQLTSQDLFGDLLAEVEEEAARPVRTPPPRPVTGDVEKQLAQTLSGMLDAPRTKAAAKPASPRPATAPTATLSAAAAAATAAAASAKTSPTAPPPVAAPPAPEPVAAPPPPAAPPPAPPPEKPAPAPVAAAYAAPAAPPTPAPPPAAAPTPAAAATPPSAAASTPAPARPAARPRTSEQQASDVEDLLSQTLSGLGVAPKPRRPATSTGAISSAAAAATAAAAAATSAPPVAPPAPREEPPAPTPPAPREEPPTAKPPVEPPPAAPERREPPPERARDKGRAAKAPPPPTPVVSVASAASPAGGFATMRIDTAKPATQETFGAYTLLDRVALGGMAEVWKARMEGVEGFRKTVAIKKILPHLTDSVDFVTMFIDEAKLAAQLNHPNIIHIYDLGKLGEDYYIAMEYVEGKDLRSILNTARKQNQPLPAGLALLIAARLASALDYAHRKRDFDNRELGLVHRDVSPQNVLISYEGDIKLCDFGIVKAVAKASKTQMGALKGKLQYMSPEQAWGRVVDGRSDIFSLGSVLFEMLTGRRLFAGESEISVLEAVRECRIQSAREVEPGISDAVDAIVRRALAKDPDDRYQTAGEMQKEIEAVLYNFKPNPNQGELAAFMHRLHGDEAALGAPAAPAALAAAAVPGTGAEVPAVAPVGGIEETESARRKPWLLPAAAVFVLVVGGLVFWLTRGNGSPAPAPAAAGAAPAATGAAPAPPGTAPATVPAAVPAAVPGGTAAMEQRVHEQLRAQEAQLEAQLQAQRKQMEAELNKPQPAASATASVKPSPTQVAAAVPPPAPAPTRAEEPPPPAPEPAAAEPEPEPVPVAAANEPAPAAPAQVSEGDFVAPGTPGLQGPAFVSVTKPQYPALAKRMGVQGVVVVSVLVNEQGAVEQTRIVRGIPQKVGINEAAVVAAKSARYRPATLGGVRVKTWANLSIPFKM
jgi:TonB family protein